MANGDLPRGLRHQIEAAWRQHPVVVVEGLRAAGKTTLAKDLVPPELHRQLADEATRSQAQRDLTGWVESLPTGVVIDEAQLLPGLALVVKQLVDARGGRPGQFLLTGSARLRRDELGGSDPLLARARRLRLHPFAQSERSGQPRDVIAELFEGSPRDWAVGHTDDDELRTRIRDGGVPPVWSIEPSDRPTFLRDFAEGLFAPDVYDTERSRAGILRLFQWLAYSSGQLRSRNTFARLAEISAGTVEGYLNALNDVHLIEKVRAFHSEGDTRETRTPRIFATDAAFVAAFHPPIPGETTSDHLEGSLAETFVAMELMRLASWSSTRASLFHWRKSESDEVDLVLEHQDGRIIGIEVKTARRVDVSHARGLLALKRAYPDRFHRGLVIHRGDHPALLDGTDVWAVPYSALWSIGEPVGGDIAALPAGALSQAMADAETRVRSRIDASSSVAVARRAAELQSAVPDIEVLMHGVAYGLRRLGLDVDIVAPDFDAKVVTSKNVATEDLAASLVAELHVREPNSERTGTIQATATQLRNGTTTWMLIAVANESRSNVIMRAPHKSPINHRAEVESLLVQFLSQLERFVDRLVMDDPPALDE
jgi:uncharacterized protein